MKSEQGSIGCTPPNPQHLQHLCRQTAVIAVGLTTCFAVDSARQHLQHLLTLI
jgi:hypothetical protein